MNREIVMQQLTELFEQHGVKEFFCVVITDSNYKEETDASGFVSPALSDQTKQVWERLITAMNTLGTIKRTTVIKSKE